MDSRTIVIFNDGRNGIAKPVADIPVADDIPYSVHANRSQLYLRFVLILYDLS